MKPKPRNWYPSLLVFLHLTFLVDTYTYNSTPSPTSTPVHSTTTPTVFPTENEISTQSYTFTSMAGSTTQVSTAVPGNEVAATRKNVAETAQSKAACIYSLDKRSMQCNADRLSQCPQIGGASTNLTEIVIKPETLTDRDSYLRKSLHNDCLREVAHLVHLTINNFGLCELFNDTFSQASALEFLDLSHNCIEDISADTFMGMNQLVSLNLSYNKIVKLDKVFNLSKLAYLNLAYNRLEFLPANVFNLLPQLRVLNLDGNKLSSMSSGSAFLGLDHLREIHMSNCELSSPPHSIFDHTQSLDSLYLSRNKMKNIPSDAIRDLYFLQHLDLSNNVFTDVPQQAFQGLALQTLDLSNNSISSIANMAFRNFRTEELYLQHNQIKVVPREALEVLARNLFVIDLSGNPLEGDRCFFPRDLIYLQKLNLSGNDLPHIPSSIYHLYQLQTLDVSFNHISTLNSTELKLIRRLEHVYLQGNPWICDCEIRDLKQLLQQQKLQYSVPEKRSAESTPSVNISKVVCERPLKLSGVAVVAVPEDILSRCTSVWSKVTPVLLYLICSFIVILILALIVFMWQKRHEMAYGRFCVEKGKDSPGSRQAHSPIKVISNTAAGAPDLSSQSQAQGPVKNQAWESALVISNPHSKLTTDDGAKQEHSQNGRAPGAETIL